VVEKRERNTFFFQSFSVNLDIVLDVHGLCVLPGWYAGRTFGQGACLWMK
jgi:hypothetical protein